MNTAEYCREKTGGGTSSLHYATLYLPPLPRRAVLAVHAFVRELDDIAEQCHEPAVAEARLQWWSREVDAVYRGDATHPVGRALAEATAHYGLAPEYLLEILDAAQTAAFSPRLDSAGELELYCHRRGAVPALLGAMIAGFDDRHILKQVHALGSATARFELLQQLGRNARAGRIYLAARDRTRHGVSEADILACRDNNATRGLITATAEDILERYQQAGRALSGADPDTRLASRVLAAINEAILEEILADPGQVLGAQVDLTPLRKLWIAWRTRRRGKAPGRFA